MAIPPNLNYADAAFYATGATHARTHAERAADWVNVKDFGATGVGDEYEEIQAAADAAFGGPTNPAGGSLVPHGYSNRKLNRVLYFPHTDSGGYGMSQALSLNQVYGGRIIADRTSLSVSGSDDPVLSINGMVETKISGLNMSAGSFSACIIDLDWDGDWDDLPVAGKGLNHNVIEHASIGTSLRGVRIGNQGFDGSHNAFMQVIIGACPVGIETLGPDAIGNMVFGGGVDSATDAAYKITEGQIAIVQGISNGSNNAVDFMVNTDYPLTILGGRTEMNGTCIQMSAGIVGAYGINFNNPGLNVAHITGGKLTLEGCGAPSEGVPQTITGDGGSLYIRCCGFDVTSPAIHSTYTGTVKHEI